MFFWQMRFCYKEHVYIILRSQEYLNKIKCTVIVTDD